MPPGTDIVAYICLCWSLFVFAVQCIGISRLFRHFSSQPPAPVSSTLPSNDVPHITIIRPAKGLEPELYECIASTFRQDYPRDKLTLHLCVSEKTDPAYPILKKVVEDFPAFDARVLVEAEDPLLHGTHGHVNNLGPNPKIRNVSRGYREAKGDIIWMIDCNVWVGPGVAGRMVDKLMGFLPGGATATPFKFVHQLPLVVDTTDIRGGTSTEGQTLLSSASEAASSSEMLVVGNTDSLPSRICNNGGGRFDEMFMSTTHAKFYSAINTVGIAPCIVGKSNMFRKSHLETITDPAKNAILRSDRNQSTGIDYFSSYICEDHLIGDLLWRSNLPGFANHGLVLGDLAIQPMAGMSIKAYFARRVRWLRARKWTVIIATLVEPGVESLLCCAYFSFALSTLPWFHINLHIPPGWPTAILIWLLATTLWMVADYLVYRRLHTGASVELNPDTPSFARGTRHPGGPPPRPFSEWLLAWLGREILALPIWTWAVLLGSTVSWRGKTFRVRVDMSVVEIVGSRGAKGRPVRAETRTPEMEMGRATSKDRLD